MESNVEQNIDGLHMLENMRMKKCLLVIFRYLKTMLYPNTTTLNVKDQIDVLKSVAETGNLGLDVSLQFLEDHYNNVLYDK